MLPADDELTRLGGDGDSETRLALGDAAGVQAAAAWPGATRRRPAGSPSSGAIDHGRFPPGTVLGDRYRIVGRLGRGGMGEVFRADDLKLGQPVALKFLPPDVDRDPARLTQLHTEVRMARQVSHPNVCRVYDIDEVEGHTFLSMEYVDGEDLGSLLRRVGRFPEDRALEIARQMCAGPRRRARTRRRPSRFQAGERDDRRRRQGAHHRLRPGRRWPAKRSAPARPPTWRPSRLAGGEVTARSDIYALGLVLYELFTGQRALDGKNLAELIRRREQTGGIAAPTDDRARSRSADRARDHALPRARSRATARARRWRSRRRFPGGDPLAAALAAGETPSPEMVAAAGGSQVMSARTAVAAAAWIAYLAASPCWSCTSA